MKVIFDVLHLYYLPQYIPVVSELKKRNFEVSYLFYESSDLLLNEIAKKVLNDLDIPVHYVHNWEGAKLFYEAEKADWIIFGNSVADLDDIHRYSKSALMQHGIGPKSCYYDVSESQTTVRFVEGQHRLSRLQSLYPNGNFVDTGFAKLDPIVNGEQFEIDLQSLGLDPAKKTILYAPTFYPSSIECFDKSFANQFSDFNIIVKPHFFTLTKRKYQKQRLLLEHWSKSNNIYLASVDDFNLVPFMALADVLISDASSAIFEFAALNKPVVWCDFYKLRWSYRGVFKFRFKQRLDSDIQFFNEVAIKANSYVELLEKVEQSFSSHLAKSNKIAAVVEKLAGAIDGNCSIRVTDYLEENS